MQKSHTALSPYKITWSKLSLKRMKVVRLRLMHLAIIWKRNSIHWYEKKKALRFLSRFTIDQTSGEIKTTTALDRESVDQHNIRVLAKDKGLSNLQAEVHVVINVSDVNDHSPVFSQRHYFVAVEEQLPAHVILNLTVFWVTWFFFFMFYWIY